MMQLINVSINCTVCKKDHIVQVPELALDKYEKGEGLVQDLFPKLTPGERELFISRICEKCFDNLFRD